VAGAVAVAPPGGVQFGGVHMHQRIGEVRQTPDVVQVQMGLHDVTHVARIQPQRPDLLDGCQ